MTQIMPPSICGGHPLPSPACGRVLKNISLTAEHAEDAEEYPIRPAPYLTTKNTKDTRDPGS